MFGIKYFMVSLKTITDYTCSCSVTVQHIPGAYIVLRKFKISKIIHVGGIANTVDPWLSKPLWPTASKNSFR